MVVKLWKYKLTWKSLAYFAIAFLIPILVAGLFSSAALADPPASTAPTIDGVINIPGEGWNNIPLSSGGSGGTLLSLDPLGDSIWTINNEAYRLYINWDATYLYLAQDYFESGEGDVLYIDFGTPAGILDFRDSYGYSGAWPRSVTFPASNGIDAFWGIWDGTASNNFYVANGAYESSDITAHSGLAVAATKVGSHAMAEARIPWSELGLPSPVYPGAGVPVINIVAGITSGDDLTFGDTVPNVASVGYFPMTVQANEFARAGVGPTAVELRSLQVKAIAPVFPGLALAACALLIAGLGLVKVIKR